MQKGSKPALRQKRPMRVVRTANVPQPRMKTPIPKLPIYYHLTSADNAARILSEGLQADSDGYIYLLSSRDVLAFFSVARSQCGIFEPVILEVCARGIDAPLEQDDVAEWFSRFQWRIKQNVIAAQHLSEVGRLKLSPSFDWFASTQGISNAVLKAAFSKAKI
jgi:hypothetical protein